MAALLALVAFLVGGLLTGCPNCPYETACEGNTLRSCSVGVDQMVGDASWGSHVCGAPNGVCVTIDDRNALCAMDAEPTCDASFAPRCGDGGVVTCLSGYRVAEHCAGDGNVCVDRPAGPACALPPPTACDPDTTPSVCDGTRVVACQRGLLVARDCARYDPPRLCAEGDNGYGHTAWCGSERFE